jgi:hypothetical protein
MLGFIQATEKDAALNITMIAINSIAVAILAVVTSEQKHCTVSTKCLQHNYFIE